jgi:hypothetical protein
MFCEERYYCLIVSTSTLKKPKGGSSGGSPCGGHSCCPYSIRERGGGFILFELLCEESLVLPDLSFMKNYFHLKNKK